MIIRGVRLPDEAIAHVRSRMRNTLRWHCDDAARWFREAGLSERDANTVGRTFVSRESASGRIRYTGSTWGPAEPSGDRNQAAQPDVGSPPSP
jgi:hypothetical protein